MENVLVSEQSLTAIADAIRSKKGSFDSYRPAQMAQEIMSIQTGTAVVPGGNENDPVRFYDYDGTLLYSYTLDAVRALDVLPEQPVHPGLLADGWNWTLSDIVAHNGDVVVGAHYTTDDGSTKLYVEVRENTLHPYIIYGQSVWEGVQIDWGDGSELEIHTGSGSTAQIVADHEYAKPGKYVVRLIPGDNCTLYLFGNNSYGGYAWTKNKRTTRDNLCYTSAVYKIEIGSSTVNLGSYCFPSFFNLESLSLPKYIEALSNGIVEKCYNLKFLTLPKTKNTSISQRIFYNCKKLEKVSLQADTSRLYMNVFDGCTNLKNVILPDTVTALDSDMFKDCLSLKCVRIPDGISSIPANLMRGNYCLEEINIPLSCTVIREYAFENCYSLREITIPEGVTSISNYAFNYCIGMKDYYLMPQTPPTIYTNTFNSIPEECVIHVPRGCLEAYQTAAYWVNYADKMVEME